MERLVVISRSKPQLDLNECIGTYEFGVQQRSLFESDGTVLLDYDKAKIRHHLEFFVSNEQLAMHIPAMETSTGIASNNENRNWNLTKVQIKVIIIDGMAIVNAIPKSEIIKTCNDFAQVFLDQLSNMDG